MDHKFGISGQFYKKGMHAEFRISKKNTKKVEKSVF
jgi:hypothetical protein